MRKILIQLGCAIITFSVGVGGFELIASRKDKLPAAVARIDNFPLVESGSALPVDDGTSFSDLLMDDETLQHNGYVIERRYKGVQLEDGLYRDQGYVVISKNGKDVRSFDASFYHPAGNSAEYGLFSFLGPDEKQLAISQVVGRGGTQWIVDLSGSTPRVIFDGEAWSVGREDSECEVKDLDDDGVFEITLPITDFYSLMDKMAVAGVPLPPITFEYEPKAKRYLPANHILKTIGASNRPDVEHETNELYFRSAVLGYSLDLIYQGKRDQAWQYFNETYNLNDKKEIERRVKAILRDQPVYKFIYNNH